MIVAKKLPTVMTETVKMLRQVQHVRGMNLLLPKQEAPIDSSWPVVPVVTASWVTAEGMRKAYVRNKGVQQGIAPIALYMFYFNLPLYFQPTQGASQRQNHTRQLANSAVQRFEIRRQTEMVSTKPMQYIVGMCAVLLWSLLGEYAERFAAQEKPTHLVL